MLMTDFEAAIVPPPMAQASFVLPAPANSVSTTMVDEREVHIHAMQNDALNCALAWDSNKSCPNDVYDRSNWN